MTHKRIALFPGSFDPFTNGHLDLLVRASKLFDEIIVAVSTNTAKNNLFTSEERIALAVEAVKGLEKVKVLPHLEGLTVDMAREIGANVLIRGLRNVKDYEYEESIALMNRTQAPELETIFLLASEKHRFLSSSLIKEVAFFGGNIQDFVPSAIYQAIRKKYQM